MPKGVIKTPADEKRWDKAKEAVKESHGEGELPWALVMHVYQNMDKAELTAIPGGASDEKLDRDALIERALEQQGRKTTMPNEVHSVLHDWWQNKGKSLLSPEQHKKLAEFKEAKQRRSKMGLVKTDELASLQKSLFFLKGVLEDLAKAEEDDKPKDNWKPSFEYKPEHYTKMHPYTSKGFSHREAAHMADVDPARLRYDDRSQRWSTGHRTSELSEPMLSIAKQVAQKHMDRHHQERGAKAMENVGAAPRIAESHHAKQIMNNTPSDWGEHLKNLKASGIFDGLSSDEIDDLIDKHHVEFRQANRESLANKQKEIASQLSSFHDQAHAAGKDTRMEAMRTILQGGVGAPVEASSGYSEQPDIEELNEDAPYIPSYLSDDEEEDR